MLPLASPRWPQMAVCQAVGHEMAVCLEPGEITIAGWNAQRMSKTQIQFVDTLGYDVVFLLETHDSLNGMQDYGGENRLLTADTDWITSSIRSRANLFDILQCPIVGTPLGWMV